MSNNNYFSGTLKSLLNQDIYGKSLAEIVISDRDFLQQEMLKKLAKTIQWGGNTDTPDDS